MIVRSESKGAVDVTALIVLALVALVALPSVVVAQESRAYAGGSFNFVTQTHTDAEPLGGTTWGGSVLFGVRVSGRVAIEFEPSFSGPYSWEYSYRPGPSFTADVIASRRDTFFSGQTRIRLGVVEPVVGLSYVHGKINRHATIGSTTYFDDSGSDDGIAVVGGVDAAFKLASHFYFVPTFRLFLLPRSKPDEFNPLREQTSTGQLAFRYGAGARVTF